MLRWISVLGALLLASPAWAGGTTVVVGQPTAVAPAADHCDDATHDGDGNAILLCEDYDGSANCYSAYSDVCRATHTTRTGTTTYNGTAIEGSYSLVIDGTAATGATSAANFSTTAATFYYFKFQPTALPSSFGRIIFSVRSDAAALAVVTLGSGGGLNVGCAAASATYTTGTMTAGNTYHVWVSYTKGTGADAACSVAFSSDGTRPTSGDNYLAFTNGNATTDPTNVRPTSEYAFTNGVVATFDHLRVATSQIGNSPP